ncbi:MAG: ParB N-terminal domain-containing protein [Pseudomonadales bacterium]|nr:ParB N-terminal domain-containing protein [Pseudomonadales bacterium]
MTNIRIDRIRLDGGTQSRAAMNEQAIADYAEALTEGATLPPITVYFDGECYWPSDGFHRIAAHKRIGALEIACEIVQGTRRDAVEASCRANATHGLPRTWDDKRRVVQLMLDDEDWSQWSNRKIARACAVSPWLVDKMRPTSHLPVQADSEGGGEARDAAPRVERKVERGGAEYTMKVGRAVPAEPPSDPDKQLDSEIAQAEAEVGGVVDTGEVAALQARVAELEQLVSELTLELEAVSAGADGDLRVEIKKLAARCVSLERVRDDFQMQNATLKRELARANRKLGAGAGVTVHA